jgi:hypothetical protein
MGRMYVLRAYRLDNVPVPCEKFRFSHLPIRIGRHPLNDFCPQNTLISAFHARVEDIDGKLCIRDLGSRNGVFVQKPGGGMSPRVEANATVELAPGGFRFFLSPHVAVQLEFVQEEAPLRGSETHGTVLGNLAMISQRDLEAQASPPARPAAQWDRVGASAAPQGGGLLPAVAGPSAYPAPLPGVPSASPAAPQAVAVPGPPRPAEREEPLLPARRGAQWGAGPSGYPVAPSNPPPPGVLSPLPAAHQAGAVPGVSKPPGRDQEIRSRSFNIELDALALQGLRELSASLIPGRPLETTGDVARLVTKLHDAVDVFCRCFIPLREGYAQFVSSLDLQRTAAQRGVNRSRSALALETATNAEAVAMALLDPHDHSFDAPEAVEGIFADLMLHQVALLDGVMQGVRALLEQLSPESIEAAVAQRGTAGLFGAKYHARWTEFSQRFERLSDERQAFAVIFGQGFAEVYRQYWRRRDGEDKGLRTGPPQR